MFTLEIFIYLIFKKFWKCLHKDGEIIETERENLDRT